MPGTARITIKLSSMRVFLTFLLLILAALLAPELQAQVTYTGTATAQNFGSQAIGSTATPVSFPFSIAAGTTVGSVAVLTQGAADLDFTTSAGTTCSAQAYASAATCLVKVAFTPKSPGVRMGAVVFFSGSANTGAVLGKALVYGVGTGPEIAYGPGIGIAIDPTADGHGVSGPAGVAVDAAGDLLIAVPGAHSVLKAPAGGGAASYIGVSAAGVGADPSGLAIDGAGDLFIADRRRVVEMPVGGGAGIAIDPIVNGAGLGNPISVAIDGAGDLFISDESANRVVEMPAGGGAAIAIDPTVNGNSLSMPAAAAVDGVGDLFIADEYNHRVVELPAGSGAPIAIDPIVNGYGLYWPTSIAVDGAGDLFIADGFNQRVLEVPAGGRAAIAVSPSANGVGLSFALDVAVDGAGNLFISDGDNNRVVELQQSQLPSLSFPTRTPMGVVDSTDGTRTVQVLNVGNEALTLSAIAYPADFSEASGDSDACTASTILSSGNACDLPIQFAPQSPGMSFNEDVTLSDDSLNEAVQQSIPVSGASLNAAGMVSPAPGTTFAGPTVTFSWSPGGGVTAYALRLGSSPGGNNLYQSAVSAAKSVTVTGLPALGNTVYATLGSKINGVWQMQDYVYTEAGTPASAVIVSPAQGSTLTSTTVTFSWTPGTGVSAYALRLATAPSFGGNNLYQSGELTGTSVTVSGLPSNGDGVDAMLGSKINGVWQYQYFSYVSEQLLAVMITPAPGSTLPGSTVTFTWTPGASNGPFYRLLLGTAPGYYDLYQATLNATSVTVTGLPTSGGTIYAALGSGGYDSYGWVYYTFTEQ